MNLAPRYYVYTNPKPRYNEKFKHFVCDSTQPKGAKVIIKCRLEDDANHCCEILNQQYFASLPQLVKEKYECHDTDTKNGATTE